MLSQVGTMETASTYFTRRAREERAVAADAGSAQARKAHLELAMRLVRVATEPALWTRSGDPSTPSEGAPQPGSAELKNALASAFPLPPSDSFEYLLQAASSADT